MSWLGLASRLDVATGSFSCTTAEVASVRSHSLLSRRSAIHTVQPVYEVNTSMYDDPEPVYVKALSSCSFRTAVTACSDMEAASFDCESYYEQGSGNICDGIVFQTDETARCQANPNLNCLFPQPCGLLSPVTSCDIVGTDAGNSSIKKCEAYYDEDLNVCSNATLTDGASSGSVSCVPGSSVCMQACLGLNSVASCSNLATSDYTCADYYEMQSDVHVICSSAIDPLGACQPSGVACG